MSRRPRTVGELKATGYLTRTVKREIRDNLRRKLASAGLETGIETVVGSGYRLVA